MRCFARGAAHAAHRQHCRRHDVDSTCADGAAGATLLPTGGAGRWCKFWEEGHQQCWQAGLVLGFLPWERQALCTLRGSEARQLMPRHRGLVGLHRDATSSRNDTRGAGKGGLVRGDGPRQERTCWCVPGTQCWCQGDMWRLMTAHQCRGVLCRACQLNCDVRPRSRLVRAGALSCCAWL